LKNLSSFNLLLFLFIVVLSSCSDSTSKVVTPENSFFDLTDYFDKESQTYESLKKVRKTVIINGKKEEQVIDNIDIKKELSIFSKCNINKLTWYDKYEVDSTFNNEQLTQIEYKAKDEDLKTQQLTVDFTNQQVSKIVIINNATSAVTDSKQELKYIPGKTYSIKSDQKLIASSQNSLSVIVEFIAP